MDSLLESALETWRTNNRINLLLVKNITAEGMKATLSTRGDNNRRGFKKGVAAHVGYFVAHESHHRGNILLTLKECGHSLDKETRYAIWDWDRI